MASIVWSLAGGVASGHRVALTIAKNWVMPWSLGSMVTGNTAPLSTSLLPLTARVLVELASGVSLSTSAMLTQPPPATANARHNGRPKPVDVVTGEPCWLDVAAMTPHTPSDTLTEPSPSARS